MYQGCLSLKNSCELFLNPTITQWVFFPSFETKNSQWSYLNVGWLYYITRSMCHETEVF